MLPTSVSAAGDVSRDEYSSAGAKPLQARCKKNACDLKSSHHFIVGTTKSWSSFFDLQFSLTASNSFAIWFSKFFPAVFFPTMCQFSPKKIHGTCPSRVGFGATSVALHARWRCQTWLFPKNICIYYRFLLTKVGLNCKWK